MSLNQPTLSPNYHKNRFFLSLLHNFTMQIYTFYTKFFFYFVFVMSCPWILDILVVPHKLWKKFCLSLKCIVIGTEQDVKLQLRTIRKSGSYLTFQLARFELNNHTDKLKGILNKNLKKCVSMNEKIVWLKSLGRARLKRRCRHLKIVTTSLFQIKVAVIGI